MATYSSASNQKLTTDSSPLFNNVTAKMVIVVTAGGTTTLTAESPNGVVFTGSTTQTLVLPDVTTLSLGTTYRVFNKSSGAVTVQSSGLNTIQVMGQDTSLLVTCVAITGTGTSSWQPLYVPTTPFTFPLSPALGGTGVANNNANTLTISGVSTINQDVSTTGSPEFDAIIGNFFKNTYDSNSATDLFPTVQLNSTSKQLQVIVAGDEFGGITFNMPDATTLVVGQSYDFLTIAIYPGSVSFNTYNGGTFINASLSFPYSTDNGAANDLVTIKLIDNSTQDGEWIVQYLTSGIAAWPLAVDLGGTGQTSYTAGGMLYANTTNSLSTVGSIPGSGTYGGAVGWGNSAGGPQFSTASVSRSPLLSGTVPGSSAAFPAWGFSVPAVNGIFYWSTANLQSNIAPANNGLLVTSASGVPSIGNSIGASISVTGSVTATTGVNTGVSGTSSATNTIYTSTINGTSYTITKSSSGTAATTFLQITVPAGLYFVGIECFIINSRAPSSNVGTSFVEKRYFSIARNGSGSDVVLDSAAGADFTSTTTTAGGALNAISGATTIVRNGSESNTSPQVVNLTINPQTTAISTGSYVAQCNILMLGSQTGFSIS